MFEGTGSPTSLQACCSALAMIAVESASVPSQSNTTNRKRRGATTVGSVIGSGRNARDEAGELLRQRGFDDDLAAIGGMRKPDAKRMQEHPLQALPRK